MSCGTIVTPSYVSYRYDKLTTLDECGEKRAELYDDVERIKRELCMMAAARPEDYVPVDCEGNRFENIEYINIQVPKLVEELGDIFKNLKLLDIIEENIETAQYG